MTRQTAGFWARSILALCLSLVFISLWLPTLIFQRDPASPLESYPGGILLLLGWLELGQFSSRGLAWLANPVASLAALLLLFRWFGFATLVGAAALVLSSATFRVHFVLVDEAGNEAPVTGLGSGFWLWYSAILLLFLTANFVWIATVSRKIPTELRDEDFINR